MQLIQAELMASVSASSRIEGLRRRSGYRENLSIAGL